MFSYNVKKNISDEEKFFGSRLKQVRKTLKLTQKVMAQLFEVTERTYIKFENGESFPDVYQLSKLIKYEINFHWLITGEGEMLNTNPFMIGEKKPGYYSLKGFDPRFCEKIMNISNDYFLQGQIIQIIEILTSEKGKDCVSVTLLEKILKSQATETRP